VSLATLPAAEGGYLLESGPRFHYLVAERDLVGKIQGLRSGAGILAIGGPDFDAAPAGIATATSSFPGRALVRETSSPGSSQRIHLRSAAASCEGLQALQFEPLPGAAKEAREIEALWTSRGAPSARLPGSGPRLLTGQEAGETLFKQIAPSFAVLHLATHGYFMGDQCDSILSSNPAEKNLFAAVWDDPLLLSGLALSGANRRANAGEGDDDGILTAEEITSLDLSGVEWVVLSACETGIGRIQAGEGVLGLRRAFESAGAGTVIMSLWKVEDESTREWMRFLYEGRLRGMSTLEAVHRASQSILDARRAKGRSTLPFHWGAFVAAGDWR
jgi:CHAT domain-containing protein